MEKKDEVFHILAGMQCLRDLNNWVIDEDSSIIQAITTFGRNGHGNQSDYLYTIAKTVERLENIGCSAEIKYNFDNLDDVGDVSWKIYYK